MVPTTYRTAHEISQEPYFSLTHYILIWFDTKSWDSPLFFVFV